MEKFTNVESFKFSIHICPEFFSARIVITKIILQVLSKSTKFDAYSRIVAGSTHKRKHYKTQRGTFYTIDESG